MARAHGWHCYEGPSLTGDKLSTHLCAECVGTARSHLKAPEALSGDVPLFDLEETAS